nr:glycotrotein [Cytorhabdovirus sp.]
MTSIELRTCGKMNTKLAFYFLIWSSVLTSLNAKQMYNKISENIEVSLVPLANCGTKEVPLESITRRCLSQCPGIEKEYKIENWRIYDPLQKDSVVNVFSCKTIKEVWKYTETWTFSRNDGIMELREDVQVIEKDCFDLYEKVCKKSPCNIVPQVKYSEEYAYASTLKKEYTYTVGTVLSLSLSYDDKNQYTLSGLPGVKNSVLYSNKNVSRDDRQAVYIWNDDPKEKKCLLKDYIVSQCLKSDKTLVCENPGIYLDKFEKAYFPLCNTADYPTDLYSDGAGFVVGKMPSAENPTYRQYLMISSTDGSKADNEILNGINELFRVKNDRDCVSGCLSILREGYKNDSITLAGYSFVKYSSGSFFLCKPLQKCRVDLNEMVCGNPRMVRVICDGESHWWNPVKMYVEPNSFCHGGQVNKKDFTFYTSLGKIYVNGSGAYLTLEDVKIPKINHPFPHANRAQTQQVDSLVRLISNDHKNTEILTNTTKREVNSHLNGIHSVDIFSSVRDFLAKLTSMEKMIVTVILGFGIICIGIVCLPFFKILFNVSSKLARIFYGKNLMSNAMSLDNLSSQYQIIKLSDKDSNVVTI